ncbi:unnamed protein product [Calypogeia fissa]
MLVAWEKGSGLKRDLLVAMLQQPGLSRPLRQDTAGAGVTRREGVQGELGQCVPRAHPVLRLQTEESGETTEESLRMGQHRGRTAAPCSSGWEVMRHDYPMGQQPRRDVHDDGVRWRSEFTVP